MTSKKFSPWRTRMAIVASGFAAFGAFTVAKAATAEAATPAVSVFNVHMAEGHAGQKLMPFNVKLSLASPAPQWVQVQPITGGATPAKPGSDFNGAGPFLVNFGPGETTKSVNVPIFGDTTDEFHETFLLKVVAHSPGIMVGDGVGEGMITNDDASPSIAINDVAKKEGTGGLTQFIFTLKLSAPSGKPVGVAAVGQSITAHVPEDLTAGPVNIAFPIGTTVRTYTANVNGDSKLEPNEAFKVALSNPTNATIADATGLGTIQNDDFLVAEPPQQPQPDPQPEPQDNGGDNDQGNNGGGGQADPNGGGSNGGGSGGGGVIVVGGDSAPSDDSVLDGGAPAGEGEQALGADSLAESRPADRQVDWTTSVMLALLGACLLGLIMVGFMIARRRREPAGSGGRTQEQTTP